ncbi:isochorismatase family cysteine hydrolase [Piscinibacter gummiphilus]|uniref:Isochorismatase family cysteine hydrolase n=1 Tax=Piscinibacter gummiphilus TaxID=946333 RepID=A0ABZ0CMP0_9BURK|nr:isochorismatase family cysteine hydrolase [Piscinibacter gummiphilus]WOB06243.1 isochorismatase family cysteine hydrolase [Piscinibacter gummiphilus]
MKPMGSHLANRWRVSAAHCDLTRAERRPVRPVELAAEPQAVTVDANRSALIVVDMQNDFCAKGGYLDYRGIDITPDRAPIEPLRRLVPALRAQGVPIVWLNWGVRRDLLNIHPSLLHAHTQDGEGAGLGERIPGGAEILLKGSWGAQIVDELNPGEQDIHVTKHRFSGFWDTELDSILRNMGLTTLFFAGVNADQCVMTTLEDASFLGYDVLMLRDCVGTTSPPFCMQATEYNVKLLYGFMTDSGALLSGLKA